MFNFHHKIKFNDKSNDVLSVGEILIDMISTDYSDNFESTSYNQFFGGAPANIAMNVNKLGANSIIASAVGKDGLGQFLINKIKSEGLDTSYIEQVDYSTSMVMITKSKSTPVPIFYRDADYHLSFSEKLEKAVRNSKIIHFSCWPISRMPARNTIERIIETARENNSFVCFDPNYHEMLWPKGENGLEYVKSMIGKADIVKPSEVDAERLFGKDTNENQLAKFIELGAKLVIMTLGSEGAIVSNGHETIKFSTLATNIVDTTGAGDAFWSGFYTAAVKGYTLKDALSLGFAVSAYKLKHVGALVNLPKLEVIKERYKTKI
ncbi:MAG: sugar kinase [Neobacillus sp.]